MSRSFSLVFWLWPFVVYLFSVQARFLQSKPDLSIRESNTTLQTLVTWDSHSIFVRGERVVFLSGEVHPFRLPSPGLWLDVFQKIRAMGFTGVSFYVMWGLLEGEPGQVRADGVFALQEFFKAASQAGIYLLARPGPYINAEVSGGGIPGWIARLQGLIRSSAPDFENAAKIYLSTIGSIISEAQITNGGPVILVQPENEYSYCAHYTLPTDITACLDKQYMAWVETELRDAGIVVPFLSNDAIPFGNFAPGSGVGAVDIYGMDGYPFQWGSSCSNPSNWDRDENSLFLFNYTTHLQFSKKTPFAVTEFQGGAPDPWGGAGIEKCASMVNNEFSRVFNKALYSMGVTMLNIYMVFGGTNWGNLGHPGGYTSYDVGAAIKEDRQITREKYSELKLQGHFLQASPSYLTSTPEGGSIEVYINTSSLALTRLQGSLTRYYIVRHADYASLESVKYTMKITTSLGNITIPQLGGALSLHGRDSKIMVSDYPVGAFNLVYSSAEILGWRRYKSRTVLLLYGGVGETHEFSIPRSYGCPTESEVEAGNFTCQLIDDLAIVQWDVQVARQILFFGLGLEVELLWRNEAYNYWILDLPTSDLAGNYVSAARINETDSSVIIRGGYLMRTASIDGDSLYLVGDVNATTDIEVVAAPITPKKLFFNSKEVIITKSTDIRVAGTIIYEPPNIDIADLSRLKWSYIDSLPEILTTYDDSNWTQCTLTSTNNTRNLTTPISLYASDYGYHSGSLLYRGHFTATSQESAFFLEAQGGDGFGYSVWLDSTYLGSWSGSTPSVSHNQTLPFPSRLQTGTPHVLTVLIDHMGLHMNFEADSQNMREPRGILSYKITGQSNSSAISWKMTGNFGGEHYVDYSRGPLNEGGIWAERKGYHLPGAPTDTWVKRTPSQGLTSPGVGFFSTKFNLSIPKGFDVPISLTFGNSSTPEGAPQNFRVQIFINGWQFGKYVNNLGPQARFILPEGILNYDGPNYLALTLWSQDISGATIKDLALEVDAVIQSGYSRPSLVNGTSYSPRDAV
ncbi:putative beta-galactosidase E [Daldinia childiae]|uniref:putative beta-galactosidase E n=1 Tax=Daldinia childiae TaxID=326645 RepID=UPI001446CBF9|nr:putative beta-galactosidase E [Daldinia childiae]KAF3071167.1 putative beta-galactosidase E [Daldinia childiae]